MQTYRVRDKRRKKWFSIDNIFLRGGWGRKVGPYGIAVYNALAMHVDNESQTAYPSHQLLADLTGMSRRQALREIQKLAELNIIATEGKLGYTLTYYLLDKEEWTPVTPVRTGYDRESHGGMTGSHTNNTHENNTKEQDMAVQDKKPAVEEASAPIEDLDTFFTGEKKKDYTEEIVSSAKKGTKQKDDNVTPPRGWRAASEAELRICRRIALLWTDDKLPWSPEDIDRSLQAAHQFLELHDGDVRITIETIDKYHHEHGDDFTVTGAYSLRNAIPKFLSTLYRPRVIKIKV